MLKTNVLLAKHLIFLAGILRTAVPDMDRETQDQYLVLLQAKDMGGHLGGLSGTTTVTVKLSDVNDNPPRFTQSECCWPGAAMGGREETGQNSNYSVMWCHNALLMGAVRVQKGLLLLHFVRLSSLLFRLRGNKLWAFQQKAGVCFAPSGSSVRRPF